MSPGELRGLAERPKTTVVHPVQAQSVSYALSDADISVPSPRDAGFALAHALMRHGWTPPAQEKKP